ncbi:MAG: hypothetical protein MUE54_10620 [Anaerolineae bacterium]|nr:hypothetical protein [Anaerolineae bacterium]
MRVRLLFACLVTCFSVFVSALPSQPAQAVARTGFISSGVTSTSYDLTVHQLGFTFLTNSTIDELVSVTIRLLGSSPVTLSLYNSDMSGNRGSFIADIATVTLFGAEQDYVFVPSTQILLQPNSYYWIQTSAATGAFGLNNSMTSDYYTFGSTQLYVVSSGTWTPIPTFSRSSIQIDTLDTLSASVACVADDIVVTISGDGNFEVRDDGALLMNNATTGANTITGPRTTTNMMITELRGDGQSLNIGGITCPGGATTPPTMPVAPAVTVLGCALDTADGIEIANAPDNTYCRVLMKDGAVAGYSGAVPRGLIDLGVILAVDVYRLEGGRSITTFPNYTQVCLAGQGRLFYLDARTSPRVQTELATEIVDGFTCGWIPAVGTVILTN